MIQGCNLVLDHQWPLATLITSNDWHVTFHNISSSNDVFFAGISTETPMNKPKNCHDTMKSSSRQLLWYAKHTQCLIFKPLTYRCYRPFTSWRWKCGININRCLMALLNNKNLFADAFDAPTSLVQHRKYFHPFIGLSNVKALNARKARCRQNFYPFSFEVCVRHWMSWQNQINISLALLVSSK